LRPIGRISSIRACGASIITSLSPTVYSNLLPVATMSSLDSHGGNAITGSYSVLANGLPVCGVGDINDVCKWIYPPHYLQPIVLGDFTVIIT